MQESEIKQEAPKSRKEREHDRKRTEILEAAEKLFFSQGYEKTTINEIASTAEFAKGTIYLYFSGKAEIYLAIINRSLDIAHTMLAKALDPGASGGDQVRAGFRGFMNFLDQYPEYFKMWLYGSRYVDEKLYLEHPLGHECRQKEMGLMMLNMNAIMKGLADGSIQSTSPPPLIAMTFMVFNRGLHQFLLENGDKVLAMYGVNRDELINQMESVLCKGLGINPG
ncbi:MAG: TetR/AcrR family transcriptional regulator [Spirochaetia bacterium]|nr:TetR/AcrR family transcriptional regulator [Spirochaetia bacterium]